MNNGNGNGKWTKELVQSHAKTAVLIEMYTLPFYLTVWSSIILPDKDDTSDKAKLTNKTYQTILSVCIEEMLHLQLAANLCLALDIPASEIFSNPEYGESIPYLQPYDPETMGDTIPKHVALLRADLGALNQNTLNRMLDIETPTEFDESLDHTTPQYPYATIGEMYDALLQGILEVEAKEPVFGWSTENQQIQFTLPPDYTKSALRINQKISCFGDAQQAVKLICDQGEGLAKSPLPPQPYKEDDFPVYAGSRFYESDKYNPEEDDPFVYNQYSHYGRFLWINNKLEGKDANDWPDTYPLSKEFSQPQLDALKDLMTQFESFIDILTGMWSGDADKSSQFFGAMYALKTPLTKCWEEGIIPQWNLFESNVDLKPIDVNLDFTVGQSWTTSTGYTFIFQPDGNLVLYNSSLKAVWASNTNNKNSRIFSVQKDGNVCIYDDNGTCIWHTNTANEGRFLSIQTDGNVVVYTKEGKPIWATNTYHS